MEITGKSRAADTLQGKNTWHDNKTIWHCRWRECTWLMFQGKLHSTLLVRQPGISGFIYVMYFCNRRHYIIYTIDASFIQLHCVFRCIRNLHSIFCLSICQVFHLSKAEDFSFSFSAYTDVVHNVQVDVNVPTNSWCFTVSECGIPAVQKLTHFSDNLTHVQLDEEAVRSPLWL